ncbi:MAG: hypothetical protein ACRDKG_16040 [Actinomycetota bacterium]
MVGDRDRVTLVEAPHRVEKGIIVGRIGFRRDLADLGLVGHVEVVTHRFDAWTWADETGDGSVVQMPDRARRRESDRRSAAVGGKRDLLTMRMGPAPGATDQIAGVPWGQVLDVIEESMKRMARDAKRAAEARACPACGRLCTKTEAATHTCERLTISAN